jgi:PAS domain S-box-containing protein
MKSPLRILLLTGALLVCAGAVGFWMVSRSSAGESATRAALLMVICVCLIALLLQKRALASLDRANEQLRGSRKALQTLLEELPVGVFQATSRGNCTFVNSAWKRMTGLSMEEAAGKGFSVALPPEDRDRLMEIWSDAVRDGRPVRLEHRFIHKNGREVWSSSCASPLRDASGRVVGWIGAALDITDRRNDERLLEEARDAARAADRAKTQFLANLSDDIRAPLSSILARADLLKDEELPSFERRHAVQEIRRSASHLLAVISDVLDISRIDAGQLRIEPMVCSPEQVLRDVTDSLRVRAVERGLSLSLEIDPAVPSAVVTDPVRLRQILVNLTTNAIAFTEQGCIRVHATSGVEDGLPELRVEVSDTGKGMSAEQVARLFRPFTEADRASQRREGGTGLGLMISREMALLLGGELLAFSAPGRGSTFVLRIPIAPRQVNERPLPTAREPASVPRRRPPMPLQGWKVLHLGDDPAAGRLVAYHLERAGASVCHDSMGSESPTSCDLKAFDAAIVDSKTSPGDALELAAGLRGGGFTGPILLVSSGSTEELWELASAAGVSEVLRKPVQRERLLEALQRFKPAGKSAA